jgi:Tfp pilus assembly protein PilX
VGRSTPVADSSTATLGSWKERSKGEAVLYVILVVLAVVALAGLMALRRRPAR